MRHRRKLLHYESPGLFTPQSCVELEPLMANGFQIYEPDPRAYEIGSGAFGLKKCQISSRLMQDGAQPAPRHLADLLGKSPEPAC
jgi:hypothetical protein